MELHVGESLPLFDAQQRPFGQLTLERTEANLLIGRFVPGPAYTEAEQLFRDFEEAVTHQALSIVDELDARVTHLGLHVWAPDGSGLTLHDVQIWSDGSITCRVGKTAETTKNGLPQTGKSAPDPTRHDTAVA